MKLFRALLLILTLTMPYIVLSIIISVTLVSDDIAYWVCLILLFVGLLSFFIDAMLPTKREDKKE